jgi:4-amino-4-deoxy-L-arabinose transferase-like glycosyltransferase
VDTFRESSAPDSRARRRNWLPGWAIGYLEPFLEPPDPASPEELHWRLPPWRGVCEAFLFLAFTVFFLTYGLTPRFGGDGLGLVGADEPRYAQIAHEMLDRFDSAHTLKSKLSACVTPYLYGHPWLEKPALYYWRAMFVFQDFGVHDWSARLPSATFAFIMIGLIYLHMRRFRPGGHLDAALITVACAGIIGFSRGASTDMQMAAPLAIGLLGWYAWYETDSKFWLYDIYFFTGLATLAKGPVAPFLAIVIVAAFAYLRRDDQRKLIPWFFSCTWLFTGTIRSTFYLVFLGLANLVLAGILFASQGPFLTGVLILVVFDVIVLAVRFLLTALPILRRSFWWPGMALYLAMVLPWFIAVQHQNPDFFRVFFLEHNLERFATDRYEHRQPFWYYLVVALLALMPWTVISVRAMIDGIRTSFREWRSRHFSCRQPCSSQPGDAFPEFLVLWALIPIVFFSFSQSKLPGYILISIPPITILTGDFIARRRQQGIRLWVLVSHAMVCGVMTMVALLMPWFVAHGPQVPPLHVLGIHQFFTFIREFAGDCIRVMPPWPALTVALMASLGAALLIIVVVKGFGVVHLRLVTTMVLVVLVFYLYGVGPFFGIPAIGETKQVIHLLDRSYSARPLAERLAASAPSVETVAVFRVRRDVEFGLSFYRNREVVNYTVKGVPEQQHLLVAQVTGKGGADLHTTAALEELLGDRHYEQLFSWPEQGLMVYMVGSK